MEQTLPHSPDPDDESKRSEVSFSNQIQGSIGQLYQAQQMHIYNPSFAWSAAPTALHLTQAMYSNPLPLRTVRVEPSLQNPIYYGLLTENLDFTGRIKERSLLGEQLIAHNTSLITQSIVGPGGIGKSQLANAYVHEAIKNNTYVLITWLRAAALDETLTVDNLLTRGAHETSSKTSSRDTQLMLSFQQFAQQLLGIPVSGFTLEMLVKEVCEVLSYCEKQQQWVLIVFDDVSEEEVLKSYVPLMHFKNVHVIITSRNQHWSRNYKTIPLTSFSETEAIGFICKILDRDRREGVPPTNKTTAGILAKTLHYLPLALAQATAYIMQEHIHIEDYLQFYQQSQQDLLNYGVQNYFPEADYHYTILTTWIVSIRRIFQRNPVEAPYALAILLLSSYWSAEAIPRPLLTKILPEQDHEQHAREVLGLLTDYSLLEPDKNKGFFTIHRMLQEVMRLLITLEPGRTEKALLAEEQALAFSMLPKKVAPDESTSADRRWAWAALESLETVFDTERYSSQLIKEIIETDRPYLPHAYQALEHVNQKDLVGEEADVAAMVYSILGDAFFIAGNLKVANECFQKDFDFLQYHSDRNEESFKLRFAISQLSLAMAKEMLGQLEEAKDYLEQALPVLQMHCGAEHPKTASCKMQLGGVLMQLDDLAGARTYLEQALPILEKHYGAENPQTAICKVQFGGVLMQLDDLTGAGSYTEQALPILEKKLGAEHPQTAICKVQFGSVLMQLGDLVGTRAYTEQALPILEKHYGAENPQTAICKVQFGSVLMQLGDLAGARTYLEQALPILEKHYGAENPQTAMCKMGLGRVLMQLGEHAGARTYLEQALPNLEKKLDAEHPQTAICKVQFGGVLMQLGDLAGARSYTEQALPILEKQCGAEYPQTALCKMQLGGILMGLGEHAGARFYAEQALPILEKHYGAENPQTAMCKMGFGRMLMQLGDLAGARSYTEQALPILEKHYDAENPQTAICKMQLGKVLMQLGEHAGARTYLEQVLPILEKHYGAEHPQTAICKMELGGVLMGLGELARAHSYTEQALPILEKHYGAEHPQTAICKMQLGGVLMGLGDLAGARASTEQALPILEKKLGAEHPQTALCKMELGGVLMQFDNGAGARAYLQQALPILEKHYGAENPQTASCMLLLGIVLEQSGDLTKANLYREKALPILQKYLPHFFASKDTLPSASPLNTPFFQEMNRSSQAELEKALRNAANRNEVDKLKVLIEQVKNINAVDTNFSSHRSALHWAVEKQALECVTLLLQRGANIMLSDAKGKTPLDLAYEAKHSHLIKLLLVHKYGQQSIFTHSLEIIFRRAASCNEVKDVEFLIGQIKSIDVKDSGQHQRTALHWAVIKNAVDCVQILLDAGADRQIIDKEGFTALHYAKINNHAHIIQLLQDHPSLEQNQRQFTLKRKH